MTVRDPVRQYLRELRKTYPWIVADEVLKRLDEPARSLEALVGRDLVAHRRMVEHELASRDRRLGEPESSPSLRGRRGRPPTHREPTGKLEWLPEVASRLVDHFEAGAATQGDGQRLDAHAVVARILTLATHERVTARMVKDLLAR